LDFPLISYRDPLFSVMILLAVIFVVSYANYLWSRYKKKSESRKLDKFLSSFEFAKNEKDYSALVKTNPEAIHSMILLASIYYKSGDYEEAIKIYLVLLDNVTDKESRVEILSMLGKTYHKAGFLHRSRDILKESLQLKARNPEVLKILLVILERLKEYGDSVDVLDSLEELGENVSLERSFLETFLIIEDPKTQETQKIEKLTEHLKNHPHTAHIILEYLFFKSSHDAWKLLREAPIKEMIDVLWNIPKQHMNFEAIDHIKTLQDIFTAKGWIDESEGSDIFELDVLIKLRDKKGIADISFEYACTHCKQIFPVYFHRCPGCLSINSCKVEPILSRNVRDIYLNELT
jgi:lipopolysaccharide biosynthesis regulator YciM